VRLNVKTKKSKEPLPYSFDATISGLFIPQEGVSDEQNARLIRLNGSAMLYGVIRGLLATVSGVGPYGPITLPSVNLVDFFERESRTTEESA